MTLLGNIEIERERERERERVGGEMRKDRENSKEMEKEKEIREIGTLATAENGQSESLDYGIMYTEYERWIKKMKKEKL
jgi:protein-disulfide isomerase-like protein with CxxC motif